MSDPAKGSAENKGLDAPQLVLQTVHELNQKPAIAIHRTADIAQQDNSGLFDALFAMNEIDNFAAVFHAAAHGPAGVNGVAFAADFFTPADLRGDFGGDEQNSAGNGAALLDAHFAEIFAVHQLLGAVRRHREFIEIFQRHVLFRNRLHGGFFETALLITAFL